jgi:hypothetical protein
VEPQAVIDHGTSPSHRSLTGHILALGIYVFIFGALAYLTFLSQGGIPGELLLIYVASLPAAIAIGALVEIRRAKRRMAAHHVISGCLNAMLLCGVGGVWVAFRDQLLFTLLGSLAVVWLTRYQPCGALRAAAQLERSRWIRTSVRTSI